MTEERPNDKELFNAARKLNSPDGVAAYLDKVCSDDPEQKQRVMDLLQADQSDGFLAEPPIELPETVLTKKKEAAEGETIDKYKLLQRIGEGGMGTVFMAEQTSPVVRRVALKIIKRGMGSDDVIARFEAERQALSLMDHPNIARVLDAGTSDAEQPYFVMELVKGVPITQYCDEKRLTIRERLELFIPVCQAIQHAHQKGIIHRDLKPSNILVAQYDDVPVPKVIDFGVAKATNQKLTERTLFTKFGQIVGTFSYMSPEQAQFNELDVDTRADLYSLGIVLYELLTGEPPLDKQRLRSLAFDELLRIIRQEEAPRPSLRLSNSDTLPSVAASRDVEPKRLSMLVRGDLDWIVMKSLEKDRTRRYESASAFAADIQRHLANEPVSACPPSASYRLRKFVRRNKLLTSSIVAVTTSLVLGLTGTIWFAVDAYETAEEEYQQRIRAETAEGNAKTQADRAETEARKALIEAQISEQVTAFLTNDLLSQASPYEQADPDVTLRAVVKRAVDSIDDNFAGNPETEAAIRHVLAVTLMDLGQYDDARRQVSRAVKLRTSVLGASHEETINSEYVLMQVMWYSGNRTEGVPLSKRLVDLSSATLGPTHTRTIDIKYRRAGFLRELGKLAEAEQLYHSLIATFNACTDISATRRAHTIEDLGLTLRSKGNPERGLALQKEAHTIVVEATGSSSLHSARLEYDIGRTLAYHLGRHRDAIEWYQRAFDTQCSGQGMAHDRTLETGVALARSLIASDRSNDADRLLDNLRESTGGKPQVEAELHHKLGWMFYEAGDAQTALKHVTRAVQLRTDMLGDDHHDTLASDELALRCMWRLGQTEAGESLSASVLERASRSLDVNDPLLFDATYRRATFLRAVKRYDESIAMYKALLASSSGRETIDALRIMYVMEELGVTLRDSGKHTEGLRVLQDALDLAEDRYGEDSFHTAARLYLLGQTHEKYMGQVADALPYYQRAFHILSRFKGVTHWRTVNAGIAVARCSDVLGQYDTAVDALKQFPLDGSLDSGSHYSIAKQYAELGRWPIAAAHFVCAEGDSGASARPISWFRAVFAASLSASGHSEAYQRLAKDAMATPGRMKPEQMLWLLTLSPETPADAAQLLNIASEVEDQTHRGWVLLHQAAAHYRAGYPEQTIDIIEKHSLYDELAGYWKAMAYKASGDAARALEVLQRTEEAWHTSKIKGLSAPCMHERMHLWWWALDNLIVIRKEAWETIKGRVPPDYQWFQAISRERYDTRGPAALFDAMLADPDCSSDKCYEHMAALYIRKGEHDKARDALKAIARLRPEAERSPEYYFLNSHCGPEDEQERSVWRARQLRQAFRAHARDRRGWFPFTDSYDSLVVDDAAFKKVVLAVPLDGVLWLQRGVYLATHERFDESRRALLRSLTDGEYVEWSEREHFVLTHTSLAALHLLNGERAAHRHMCERAVAAFGDRETRENLRVALVCLLDPAATELHEMARAELLIPDAPMRILYWRKLALIVQAMKHLRSGEHVKANEDINACVNSEGGQYLVPLGLAVKAIILSKAGSLDDAETLLNRAQQSAAALGPFNPPIGWHHEAHLQILLREAEAALKAAQTRAEK